MCKHEILKHFNLSNMLPWSGVFHGQGGKKYGIKVWLTHDNLLNTMFMSSFRLVTQPKKKLVM